MTRRRLRTVAMAVGLLLVVYLPAFAVVSLIRPSLALAIPLVIGISLAISILLMVVLSRRTDSLALFGLRASSFRHVAQTLLIGMPLALVVAWLAHVFPSPSPIDTSKFPVWMLALFFLVGSPIQEEIIFRGLLQSFVQQRWLAEFDSLGISISAAVLFVAVLFAIVHLGNGPVVFIGAIVLGIVAGELRRRSGSLLPAMIVHALFNLLGIVWP